MKAQKKNEIVHEVEQKKRKNNKVPHVWLPGQRGARFVWARNTFKWRTTVGAETSESLPNNKINKAKRMEKNTRISQTLIGITIDDEDFV